MASLEFYAAPEDVVALMEFVFSETDCRVYEQYSECGRALREFESVDALQAAYPLGEDRWGRGAAVMLALYSPSTGGEAEVSRIKLAYGVAPIGREFRFEVCGWGLIHLQLSGTHARTITASRLTHNTEARAQKWEQMYTDRLPAACWDWTEVMRLSRKLQYQIRRKLASATVGSRPVLHAAEQLLSEDYTLGA